MSNENPNNTSTEKLYNLYTQDGKKLTTVPIRESELQAQTQALTESTGNPVVAKQVLFG